MRGSQWAHEVYVPFPRPLYGPFTVSAENTHQRVDRELERTIAMRAILTSSIWVTGACLDLALKNAVRSTRRPFRLGRPLIIDVCFEYGFETLVTPS